MTLQRKFNYGFIVFSILNNTLTAKAQATSETLVSGGLTQTNLFTTKKESDSSHEASFDLVIEKQSRIGDWTIHSEGSSTPQKNGVSAVIENSNGDSGSALNKNGKARLQISELFLTNSTLSIEYQIGLFDLGGLFDCSNIANDETTQFLSGELVNNTTIHFPDYTLGVAATYSQEKSQPLNFRTAVTSSNGLADNPDRSYSEAADVLSKEKGYFAIGEFEWNSAIVTRLGAWHNSSLYYEDKNEHSASGFYGSLSRNYSIWAWNFRLGSMNESNNQKLNFFSGAFNKKMGLGSVGFGSSITRTKLDSQSILSKMSEGYYKQKFADIEGTISFQWRQEEETGEFWIAGVRFNYIF